MPLGNNYLMSITISRKVCLHFSSDTPFLPLAFFCCICLGVLRLHVVGRWFMVDDEDIARRERYYQFARPTRSCRLKHSQVLFPHFPSILASTSFPVSHAPLKATHRSDNSTTGDP